MKYHVLTYGCQMNFADSRLLGKRLEAAGWQQTPSIDEAEFIMVNTCCVRANAENRAYGRLLSLKPLKESGSLRVLGVCGCLAQQDAERMLAKVPHLDLVLGTRALDRLPAHLEAILDKPTRIVDVQDGPPIQPAEERLNGADPLSDEPRRDGAYPIFVSITRGCDNRCAYCVVPKVRGPLESFPSKSILEQVRRLVDSGWKEITLIGQNVNVYQENGADFPALLRRVHEIPGLERIRFITSHPRDLTDSIIDAVAELPKVCEFFHLPLQSASDRILSLMRRGYTSSQYVDLVGKIRDRVKTSPNSGRVAVTTDLIVGFPGETDEDFEKTMECARSIRWDSAFTFIYSARPGIDAEELPDKVPHRTKVERIGKLIALQKRIGREINDERLNQLEEVLVESPPAQAPSVDDGPGELVAWRTRTRNNKIVNVLPPYPENSFNVGDILVVRITEARAYTLFGQFVERHS